MDKNNNSDKNENDEGNGSNGETNFNNIVAHSSSRIKKIIFKKLHRKYVKYCLKGSF